MEIADNVINIGWCTSPGTFRQRSWVFPCHRPFWNAFYHSPLQRLELQPLRPSSKSNSLHLMLLKSCRTYCTKCLALCAHPQSAVWVTFLSYPYVSLLMACLYCFESLHHHEPGKGLNKYCWLIEAMIKHEQYLILKNTHLRIFHIPFPPYSPIANWEARWINTKISEPRNQFNFTVSKHGNPPSSTHGSCYVCKWEGSAVKIQPLE